MLDIGSHIGYLQGLFCRYLESDKGRTSHGIFVGLPLRGDLIGYIVNPMRACIIDYDTSYILKGFVGPSWERHTYSSEGDPFSTTISCLCAFGLFVYFLV